MAKRVTAVTKSMGGREPRSEIMIVTPEMASTWLARNTESNRAVRDSRVVAFARDMTAGKWELTHQGIGFNRSGELVDGQHRLCAIVKANVPVKMLVSTGFAIEYNSMLDRGAGRTPSDILRVTNKFVAAVRCLHVLSHGYSTMPKGTITVAEIAETADANEEALLWVNEHVLERGTTTRAGIQIGGWVAGAIAFAWPLDKPTVASFVEGLITGELLERSDPPYVLRNWLARRSEKRPTTFEMTYATCLALKHALTNTPITRIVQKQSGGTLGYAWLCQRRRAEHIPNTPEYEDSAPDATQEAAAAHDERRRELKKTGS